MPATWDATGSGRLEESRAVDPAQHLELARTVVFGAPGTYFAAVRVTSHAAGGAGDGHAHVPNLARVRILVED